MYSELLCKKLVLEIFHKIKKKVPTIKSFSVKTSGLLSIDALAF